MIDEPHLAAGRIYEIRSRNLRWAVYLGDGLFRGMREKFGERRIDVEALGATVTCVIREVGAIDDNCTDEQLLAELGNIDREMTPTEP